MNTPSTILSIFTAGLFSVGAYELHEWGTFTTVSGSDGVLLTGLEREDETLRIENRTGGDIPYLIVYEKLENGSTRWREAKGPLAEGKSVEFSESELAAGKPGFDEPLYRTLRDNLAARGLLRSEADAMVQTWWQSYFERPGLRVFWLLPDSRTDAILPLSVTPAPAKTVRVIVGRSEVIRPRQETEWVKLSRSGTDEDKARFFQLTYDRFGLAYQERIKALTSVSTTDDGSSLPSTVTVSSSSSSAAD